MMRFRFGAISIAATVHGSAEEVRRTLRGCKDGTILAGSVDEPTEFYAILIRRGPKMAESLGIELRTESHGIPPELLVLGGGGTLFLGHDQQVVVVDTDLWRLVNIIRLRGAFHEFHNDPLRDQVLCLYDIGVCAVSHEGTCRWNFRRDVIIDYTINGAEIGLRFMDTSPVRLNLQDGGLLE